MQHTTPRKQAAKASGTTRNAAKEWPIGGGEMGALVRAHDWAATPLGPIDQWPQSLRTALDIVFANEFPAAIAVGPEAIALYNDAYARVIGSHHPEALGHSILDVFAEARDHIEPLFERVWRGETVLQERQLYPFIRNGVLEDAWFAITFAPLRDDHGAIGGVFSVMIEVTAQVLAERAYGASAARQAFLLKLSDTLRPLSDAVEIQAEACRLLGEHLRVDRTYYVEVNAVMRYARIDQDYVRGDSPSLVGRFRLEDYGWVVPHLERGETVVVEDTQHAEIVPDADRGAMAGVGIISHITTPIVKAGALVGALCVTESTTRTWSAMDIELVRETAERIWDAIERARTEAMLRASEERFRTLFEFIDEGFALVEIVDDEQGDIADLYFRRVNQAFERQTGLSDVLNKTVAAVFPNVESYWIDIYRRVSLTGEAVRTENYVRDLDRWYNVYFSRVGGVGSHQVAVVFNDVTERKHAEEALRESRVKLARELEDAKRLQTISGLLIEEENDEGLYLQILDAAMAIMRADFGSIQMLDAECGELDLIAWRNFHPESAAYWQSVSAETTTSCGSALRHGKRVIVRDVHADAAIRDSESGRQYELSGIAAVQSTPLTTRDGRVMGMISTHWREVHTPDERELRLLDILARQATDSLERRRDQQALRTSEERFRAVANLVPDLLWSSDAHGVTTWYNRRWLEYTGQGEHATRLGWLDMIHPDDRATSRAHFQRAITHGRSLSQEHRIRRADGVYRWFLMRAEPVRDDAGHIIQWYGTATDIHEQRAKREELAARVATATTQMHALSRRLLQVHEEERRHLARELHDEIGQALTGLQLQFSALGRTDTPGATEARTQAIAEAQAIVHELTERVSALSMDLRPAALDTLGLLPALIWYVERYQTRSGILVDLRQEHLDQRLAPDVEVAAFRVVQEALTNVARHADTNAVSVRLLAENGMLTVVIRDAGRGFDVAATPVIGGLGGMRERIELLGGALEIDSSPGSGTTITAEIPLGDSNPSPKGTRI